MDEPPPMPPPGPATAPSDATRSRPPTAAVGAALPDREGAAKLIGAATPQLEGRLSVLRSRSTELSAQLTQRLATSQSGQDLLHIGPSLSTLPPDLRTLLDSLRPPLEEVERFESASRSELEGLVRRGDAVRAAARRAGQARECAEVYADLCRSEEDVRGDGSAERQRQQPAAGGYSTPSKRRGPGGGGWEESEGGMAGPDLPLDRVCSLERAAYTTLYLVQELQASTAEVTDLTSKPFSKPESSGPPEADLPSLRAALPPDTDKAQFLMKLAPRIRRLESDTVKRLTARFEDVLMEMKARNEDGESPSVAGSEERDLLMIGHCLRGLALLGRGKKAEGAFARVAIMPLIRSRVAMGRLDEGGARGECAGLFSLLDDIAVTIRGTFGQVLRLSEATFGASAEVDGSGGGGVVEIDLVTAGVWVPLATSLMADPAIKMALFSPGIAAVLQANYTALNVFLAHLAEKVLAQSDGEVLSGGGATEAASVGPEGAFDFSRLYFSPEISPGAIRAVQARLYRHSITLDFTKRWNLPIYYQLRFGECCTRLNKAMATVQKAGWESDVYTGKASFAAELRNTHGFELPLFFELYDALVWLWKPDVILRPLSHRFLRGAIQLVGRFIAFVRDGLEGKIRFGEIPPPRVKKPPAHLSHNGESPADVSDIEEDPSPDNSYCWGERLDDIATVAWELTVLETSLSHDYAKTIASAIAPEGGSDPSNGTNTAAEVKELQDIISDALLEASQDVAPVIRQCWGDVIVSIFTAKCSGPLSAVRGVAATYRMTNRPAPTQPSPFVATILRPLKEFDRSYASRTPPQVGTSWKISVVSAVAETYSAAVEELVATVERTENALRSRQQRRTMSSGGISDGDKVKLQLFLDHQEFARGAQELGVDVGRIPGLAKLKSLTEGAVSLHAETQQSGAQAAIQSR